MEFRYHFEPNVSPYQTLGRLHDERPTDAKVVLGHAERLPAAPPDWADESVSGRAALLFGVAGSSLEQHDWTWSGWAVVNAHQAGPLAHASSETELLQRLTSVVGATRLNHPAVLDVRTVPSYHQSNFLVLGGGCGSPLTASLETGTHISRRASVHRTARLSGPICIGSDVEVCAGAQIGPNVVVGEDCVIERGAVLRNTVVLPGTYVGKGVRLDSCVVDQDRVISLAGAGWSVSEEEFPAVGSLVARPFGRLAQAGGRLASGLFSRFSNLRPSTRLASIDEQSLRREPSAVLTLD